MAIDTSRYAPNQSRVVFHGLLTILEESPGTLPHQTVGGPGLQGFPALRWLHIHVCRGGCIDGVVVSLVQYFIMLYSQ